MNSMEIRETGQINQLCRNKNSVYLDFGYLTKDKFITQIYDS